MPCLGVFGSSIEKNVVISVSTSVGLMVRLDDLSAVMVSTQALQEAGKLQVTQRCTCCRAHSSSHDKLRSSYKYNHIVGDRGQG